MDNSSTYGSAIFDEHQARLMASRISVDVAKARDYRSADQAAQLIRHGFADAKTGWLGGMLLMPVKTSSVFKSRWKALLWAAGVLFFAYTIGGSMRASDPKDGNGHINGSNGNSGGSGHGLALHSTMMAVVGGSLSAESVPGEYTRVVMSLPVDG